MNGDEDSALLSIIMRRERLLSHLAATPTRKCELTDELEVSRSTVDRAIRELEQAELVEREGRRYRTTLTGTLALEEFYRCSDRMTNISETQPILGSLSSSTSFSAAFLDGAEICLSQRPDPHRPTQRLESLIESADKHCAYAPAFLTPLVVAYQNAVLDGLEMELALTTAAFETALTDHRTVLASGLETGQVHIRETPASETVPYSVVISYSEHETVAAILVYVDSGLKGVIYNDDPDAVAWAESVFAEIWERATPIPLSQ